jgi:hypothetical protein
MQKAAIITRKVVTESTEEVSINMPYFTKKDNAYFKVISADEMMEIQLFNNCYFLSHRKTNTLSEIERACGFDPCDQIEFLKAVEAMLTMHNDIINAIMGDAPILDLQQNQTENLSDGEQ